MVKEKFMRRVLLFIGLVSILTGLKAQNELEIANIREPGVTNYSLDDSVNVEVVMRNVGPNTIFATDLITFDIKISTVDTTIFRTVDRVANTNLSPTDVSIYTLLTNFPLNTQNNYEVCVGVAGTANYPTNTSKVSAPCVSFPVGIKKNELKADKLYYVEGQLRFRLSETPQQARYRILDLSGKVLKSGTLKAEKNQQVYFQAPANGLYFLQLESNEGNPSTQKFIVR